MGSCEGQNNTVKQPLQGELQEQQQHMAQKGNTQAKVNVPGQNRMACGNSSQTGEFTSDI